ncbi:MAG: hypothetical protein M1838_000268 [Thelocarpon superellum]|nr:MAG: hypothetical protein M1838_000268 [Thelocarpon superellum]
MADLSSSDVDEAFTRWTGERGLMLHKIASARLPGRGVGIVATERIKAGECLLMVPTPALVTAASIPAHVSGPIGPMSVHGLLAATLTLDGAHPGTRRAEWRHVWPRRSDLDASMPVWWPAPAQDLLPPAAKALLRAQQQKLAHDLDAVVHAFPEMSRADYAYHWLIVNTRSFYYHPPGNGTTLDAADCMALCPLADHFNHAARGCSGTFGPDGFSILSDRTYESGEEVCISYGHHSNDLLLVEYGFVLADNEWDEMRLDHLILPTLTAEQKSQLDAKGKYVVDRDTVCYRTEVALRLSLVPVNQWIRFVHGTDEGTREQGKVDEAVATLLEQFRAQAWSSLEEIRQRPRDERGRRALETRWTQVLRLLDDHLRRGDV